MIVVDASVMLDLLLRVPDVAAIERWVLDPAHELHAPHLLDIEIAQVVRRHTASRAIDAARGHAALSDLMDLPIIRHPHTHLLPRVWALRENLTAYDAVYVALAESLDAPLITRDRRLAAAPGHNAMVELV